MHHGRVGAVGDARLDLPAPEVSAAERLAVRMVLDAIVRGGEFDAPEGRAPGGIERLPHARAPLPASVYCPYGVGLLCVLERERIHVDAFQGDRSCGRDRELVAGLDGETVRRALQDEAHAPGRGVGLRYVSVGSHEPEIARRKDDVRSGRVRALRDAQPELVAREGDGLRPGALVLDRGRAKDVALHGQDAAEERVLDAGGPVGQLPDPHHARLLGHGLSGRERNAQDARHKGDMSSVHASPPRPRRPFSPYADLIAYAPLDPQARSCLRVQDSGRAAPVQAPRPLVRPWRSPTHRPRSLVRPGHSRKLPGDLATGSTRVVRFSCNAMLDGASNS
jgi:hypothetical protein